MIEPANTSREIELISQRDYVRCVWDPFNDFANLFGWFNNRKRGTFVLCNAGTRASEYPGISAAGVDPIARRFTPAVDAEALVLGRTISAESLPVSPLGIVSPVVISRACLSLLNIKTRVVDCGSFYSPQFDDVLVLSNQIAECPSSASALPKETVDRLFAAGCKIGKELARVFDFLILAECVPGGTTTAAAIMNALGYEVNGLVSSSLPNCNHAEKWALVEKGFINSGFSKEYFLSMPLQAVSCFGDPMQAVVAGIAATASKDCQIFLAGGSQMLAIWALLKALSVSEEQLRNILILTTEWVAFDQSAGVQILAQQLQAPMAAASPDFRKSRHAGLQAYEEGNVKEGVGAGASMCLAYLSGFDPIQIQAAIDNCYDELVAVPAAPSSAS